MSEDSFKFVASVEQNFVTTEGTKTGAIVGAEEPVLEIVNLQAIWGTNGTAIVVSPVGMHVDPVIPEGPEEIVTPPAWFEDPLFG